MNTNSNQSVFTVADRLPPHIRGILYKEWLAHRNLIVGFWAAWLTLGLAFPVFHHPAWIFALGLLYAVLVAPATGGMDAAEGSEEFAFSLPPTRSDIYLTRLALAGGNLLALLATGLLTLYFEVPQRLWGLFVESGFTEPFPIANWNWYIFALLAPLAVFACAFVFAALAKSRAAVGSSWFLGAILSGTVAGGGIWAEWLIWKSVTIFIAGPALLILTAGALLLGYTFYLHKEGLSRPTPMGGRSRWWVWVMAIGVAWLLLVLMFWARTSRHATESRANQRMNIEKERRIAE